VANRSATSSPAEAIEATLEIWIVTPELPGTTLSPNSSGRTDPDPA
jgi:hypothetical protein